MKTLEKQKYQSDIKYFELILNVFKSDTRVKIQKNFLFLFLNYIDKYKVERIAFNILFDNSQKYVIIFSTIIEKEETKPIELELNFKPFNLTCFNVACLYNKYSNNTYTCTKEIFYGNCETKKTNILKSDL